MSTGTLLLVGISGAIGGLLRFAIDSTVMRYAPRALPLGTLIVNLSAALLLGSIVGLAASTRTTLITGTGLMGGYSTFSTWIFETHRLTEDGRARWAALHIAASAVIGVLAIIAGRAIGLAL